MGVLKVLIGCEESQTICKAFRKLGIEAYSNDMMFCSGGNPEWHIIGDVLQIIKGGEFLTEAGTIVKIDKWDLGIFHPPCTFLAVSGARWLYNKDGSKNEERWKNQQEGLDFVQKLMDADIPHIAVENPISVISSHIRKPDQIIQPWMFGDEISKSTCLWLKDLPLLEPTNIVGKGEFVEWVDKSGKKKRQAKWYLDALSKAKTKRERQTMRSKTFQGIADAIADQYSKYLINK